MATKTLEWLETMDGRSFPSQYVREIYETIHLLMESLASIEGIKFDGEGAHAKLIMWSSDTVRLTRIEKTTLQQLRRFRNKLSYEGEEVTYDYVQRNQKIFTGIIKKLFSALEERGI